MILENWLNQPSRQHPPTREYVLKAEGDYASDFREWRARKHPNYDALCFHAQQCAKLFPTQS